MYDGLLLSIHNIYIIKEIVNCNECDMVHIE